MSLTMNSVFGDIVFKYRIYIFQMITMTVHVMCVIDPLINIFIYSKKKQKLVVNIYIYINFLFYLLLLYNYIIISEF